MDNVKNWLREFRNVLRQGGRDPLELLDADLEKERNELTATENIESRLLAAIGRYWDLAYAEGKEGRTHDTKDGAGQLCWLTIKGYVAALALSGKDSERLDWLGALEGTNLVSDDAGRWAVSGDGFQPVPDENGFTRPVLISSHVEPEEWRQNIRAAIDAAMEADKAECAGLDAVAGDGLPNDPESGQ